MLRVLFLLISVSVLPLRSNAEVLSISQFGAIAPQSGEFQISGYVVKHYLCTPFPTSGLCAPCMPNNVLLSEKNEVLASYPQKGNYLVVNTPNPESFKLGSLCEITVRVLESSFFNGNYGVRDLELMKKGNEKWR